MAAAAADEGHHKDVPAARPAITSLPTRGPGPRHALGPACPGVFKAPAPKDFARSGS